MLNPPTESVELTDLAPSTASPKSPSPHTSTTTTPQHDIAMKPQDNASNAPSTPPPSTPSILTRSQTTLSMISTQPILISSKLFIAMIFVIIVSIFLSLTYITGLSRRQSTDRSVNYLPTMQSGYGATTINLNPTSFICSRLVRSINPLSFPSPSTPVSTPTFSILSEYSPNSCAGSEKSNNTKSHERFVETYRNSTDLFGFSGVISNDGLPIFSMVSHGEFFHVMHCENLLCTERSVHSFDFHLFNNNANDATNNLKMATQSDGVVVTRDPTNLPIPTQVFTKTILSAALIPFILVVLDDGRLFLIQCVDKVCSQELSSVTLLHPSILLSPSLKIDTNGHVFMLYATNNHPIASLPAVAFQLSHCVDQSCSSFMLRNILGLYVSENSAFTTAMRPFNLLSVTFSGFWLYTPFPTELISLIQQDIVSPQGVSNSIDYQAFSLFNTPSMPLEFPSILLTMLYLNNWITPISPSTQDIQSTNNATRHSTSTSSSPSQSTDPESLFPYDHWKLTEIDPTGQEFEDQFKILFELFYSSIGSAFTTPSTPLQYNPYTSASSHHQPSQDHPNKSNKSKKRVKYSSELYQDLPQPSEPIMDTYNLLLEQQQHHPSSPQPYNHSMQYRSEHSPLPSSPLQSDPTPFQQFISSTTFPFTKVALDQIAYDTLFASMRSETKIMLTQYLGLPISFYQTISDSPNTETTSIPTSAPFSPSTTSLSSKRLENQHNPGHTTTQETIITQLPQLTPRLFQMSCALPCLQGAIIITLPITPPPPIDGQFNLSDQQFQSVEHQSSSSIHNNTNPSVSSQSLHKSPTSSPSTQSYTFATAQISEPTPTSGRIRDIQLLKGSPELYTVLLYDDPAPDPPSSALRQSISSFRCQRNDCRRELSQEEQDSLSTLSTSTSLHEPSQQPTQAPLYTRSTFFRSLFNGAVARAQILSNLTTTTHLATDSDPFLSSYHYFLFDFNQVPIYGRCFTSDCAAIHIQPLMGSTLTRPNTTTPTDPKPAWESRAIGDLAVTLEDDDNDAHDDDAVFPTVHCLTKPCFTIMVSPIDSMVLLLVGNREPRIFHCSNPFCVPYYIP